MREARISRGMVMGVEDGGVRFVVGIGYRGLSLECGCSGPATEGGGGI